ncbi:hypothetical protein EW026_g7348 [Hermanssonia centrifuga]|uniref:RNA-directed DNA polymerase n=1 Tax=Hermanssonia centrifuga TaxID=98765 RepID=A0A4S4K845_9APHY|nr:hypothetical protein EW026_g7348 [Hermanssonia centrifuga]
MVALQHIESHAFEELRILAETAEVIALADFQEFKETLSDADSKRRIDRNRRKREIEAFITSRARFTIPAAPSRTSANAAKPLISGPSAGSTANVRRAAALPKLTDGERKLLEQSKGCLKCRKLNAGHFAKNCPNGFPDAASYRDLVTGKVAIAPIAEIDTVEGDIFQIPHVGAVQGTSSAPSCVLTSDDDDWDSNMYVKSSISLPHILWKARLHSPSSILESTEMLIDTGCTTVLIRDDVVKQHALRCRPLHKPFQYRAAFGSEIRSSKEMCRLRLSTTDNSWSSKSVNAIIVPKLCYPVILGLPFYTANELLIDPSNRLLLNSNGRDLLSPIPRQHHNIRTTRQKRMDNRQTEKDWKLMEQESVVLESMMEQTRHKDVIRELNLRFGLSERSFPPKEEEPPDDIVASIRQRIDELALLDILARENKQMRDTFSDIFPDDIPHINELPTDVYHRFRLKDPNAVIARRQYECPKKYRKAWKTLLQQHLAAGRIRPSSSPHASPAFLIPKADRVVLPRWVNDYRKLNANTIPNVHPLPSIAEILSDCGKGQYFAKIDMTNSFFQTLVHPDDIPLTAVTTPFGLYEWTVMPQGCRNAPATHQRRMFNALRDHIGSICHVYLDDIVIWSQTLDEHRKNVATILACLRQHKLYCSPKKTDLFCLSINFLGHYISANGIEANNKKVEKILDWPIPRSASDVRAFLGLVRYISNFLPALAHHTLILNTLTTKEAEKDFSWTPAHFQAFEAVKLLVTSRECLTVIDHNNLGNNRVFVSCDASDFCTGAVLSYGETPETARPVAFESQQLSGAELNYPVHEKELLAIVRAMKKWRVDLLGVPFTVFLDHRTLENFTEQKHLSRRQARWQEFMSQYDYVITYIAGVDNAPADSMSRKPPPPCAINSDSIGAIWAATTAMANHPPVTPILATVSGLRISCDADWISAVKSGYEVDSWCSRLIDCLWDPIAQKDIGDEAAGVSASEALGWLDSRSRNGVSVRLGMLYVGNRLVVPRTGTLREDVFKLAHDTLGHWGNEKSYGAIRASYSSGKTHFHN